MRYVGPITDWNDEKGFGFVMPDGGGDRAFVHIKAFERTSQRPISGQLISYELHKDDRGRLNAGSIRYVSQRRQAQATSSGTRWPRRLIAALILAALLFGWLAGRIPIVFPVVYVAMSVLTFLMYAIDKSAAMADRWRTKESTLHVASLLGGWPGALFAQELLHHKSVKAEFQFTFWITVVANSATLAWLLASGRAAAINRAALEILAHI
jgi:uncharacterized membrane protein YsdA (DUF1294 family)/cold shock CspA family protein